MNKNRLSIVLSCGLLILLTACQAVGQSRSAALPQPAVGEAGASPRLTKGAAEAPSLWAFCDAAQENTPVRTFDCRAPASQTLAVGHLFLLEDSALLKSGSADLEWEVSIDGALVDLESFGTFDYVIPTIPRDPSPIREVFAKMTDWNLVMTDLNTGEHILFLRAKDEAGYYHEWLVYLTIEGEDGTHISAIPFQPKS